MMSWAFLRSCAQVTVFCLLHHACAYLPGTGSFVTGDLSIAAPYGISPVEFGNITERLSSRATFNMTGYDISLNAGPTASPEWTLTIGVTTDVSMVGAANSSELDFEATTLFIEPPGGNITMDPSWRICAVVFPGLATSTSPSTSLDGTCTSVLSGDCIEAIQGGSSGIDNNGNCGDYAVPTSCTSELLADPNNNTAFAIDQTVLNAKRFYAYGSPATQTTNETAYAVARENVWPVVTLFSHLSDGGTISSLNTAVQCVRATNGTTTAPSSPISGAGRYEIPTLIGRPGLFFVLFIAGYVFTF